MKKFINLPLHTFCFALLVCIALIAPDFVLADCSENEQTAVFILDNIYPMVPEEGSFWNVDPFNCANLDPNTPDNQAWWCGTMYPPCWPDDPPEGYGNGWNQWLGWRGTVADPDEPVTVTVRARMNLDTEIGYDYIHLQYLSPQGDQNVWSLDGFHEGLLVEQTFTLQPEDYVNPSGIVHLRWTIRSDGAFSDEDCFRPTVGAVQMDLIEVFFDQGAGPVQVGPTETCEPASDLQWGPEWEELQLTLLDVAPLGPVINPSIGEMIEAANAIQPAYYQHHGQVGPFHLLFAEPGDFGGAAIVDGRDGRVVFAGTSIWMGQGSVTLPAESSHAWSFPSGNPATEPASVGILPTTGWSENYGTPAEITATVLEHLRSSDVLESFSDCGNYDVVSYIYTPAFSPMDPEAASLIVVVSGKCGAPWADFVAGAGPVSSVNRPTRVYPNPFNPRTKISFYSDKPQKVRVTVFDSRGRRIAVLTDQQYNTGEHSVEWRGQDSSGRALSSGEYFFRVDIGGRVETRKAMLLR